MAWSTPPTFNTNDVLTAANENIIRDCINALFPTGSYLFLYRTPTRVETLINGGWLECNGASVSTTTYANLFAVIGYTYGGAGASFTLPDYHGRTPVGLAGSGHVDVNTLGDSDGLAIGSRRPAHNQQVSDAGHGHTFNAGSTNTTPGHAHSYTRTAAFNSKLSGGAVNTILTTSTTPSSSLAGAHTHTASFAISPTTTGVTAATLLSSAPTNAPAYLVAMIMGIKI